MTLVAALCLAIVARWSSGPASEPHPSPAAATETMATRTPEPPAPSAAAEDTGLIIPVAAVRPEQLVDTFAQARVSGARRHDAIDIMAPRGTPVVAAAPGTVEKLFLSKEGGKTVYVRSLDGRRLYYYAHLDRYAPGLAEGMKLPRGAPIGAVGSTGNASPEAPHLHFAIGMTSPQRKWWEETTALNPYPLLRGR